MNGKRSALLVSLLTTSLLPTGPGVIAQTPEMITVEAASFEMGSPPNTGFGDERPVHTVYLSTYEIGRFEVTNAEYAAYLNSALAADEITVTTGTVFLTGNESDPLFRTQQAHGFSQIAFDRGGFSPRTAESASLGQVPMDDHAVLAVTWYGAAAHCNWLSRQRGFEEVYTQSGNWAADLTRNGYHLPTEAQWERAAAWAPDYGHWGYGYTSETADASRANCERANPLELTARPFTSPVGYYNGENGTEDSPSPVGCYDMSGNAQEWCHDWYGDAWYSTVPMPDDPTGPESGTLRVARGGGWVDPLRESRTAFRYSYFPDSRFNLSGFRIARNP